jgi:hypothetical protein
MHNRYPISSLFADRLLDVMYNVGGLLFTFGHYSKETLHMTYFMIADLPGGLSVCNSYFSLAQNHDLFRYVLPVWNSHVGWYKKARSGHSHRVDNTENHSVHSYFDR